MSAYSFGIVFRGTELHSNADGLLRLPLHSGVILTVPKPDVVLMFNIVQMSSLLLTHSQLKVASRHDSAVSRAMDFTKNGWLDVVDAELQPFWRRCHELTVEAECLLWGYHVVIPKKCQKKVLEKLHKGHPGMARMKSLGWRHRAVSKVMHALCSSQVSTCLSPLASLGVAFGPLAKNSCGLYRAPL